MSYSTKEVYVGTNSLGVYHTSDFDSLSQPSWEAINAGLANLNCKQLALDPFVPDARQYVLLTDGTLYSRLNGGSWVEKITAAGARSVLGVANGAIKSFCCDTLVPGRLWALFTHDLYSVDPRWMRSDNYGTTWTGGVAYVSTSVKTVYAGTIRAHGDYIFIGWEGRTFPTGLVLYSADAGATWSYYVVTTSQDYPMYVWQSPLLPEKVYYTNLQNQKYERRQPLEELVSSVYISSPSRVRISSADINKQWILTGESSNDRYLHSTADHWATKTVSPSPLAQQPTVLCPQSWVDDVFIFGHPAHISYAISIMTGAESVLGTPRAGANYNVSPYTNSIPETHGGVCWDGVQAVKEASGVYTYGVDFEDALAGKVVTYGVDFGEELGSNKVSVQSVEME